MIATLQILVFALSVVLVMPVPASDQQADNANRLILVAGATGRQGGAVARELQRRGYRVRGLTRHAHSDRARALIALGVEMVQGDFDDAPSLDRALDGAYGAYSVQNWRGIGAGGEIRQGEAFADAARRAGVKHFVYSSVAAAARKTGVPHFDSKVEIEAHIRAIGLPYTIIRPASFMSNLKRSRKEILAGVLRGPLPPQKKLQYIAVRDIGRFAADAFDDPDRWLGRTIEIAGDEKSNTEVAAILSRVLGRPVNYEQIPWDKFAGSAPPPIVAMVNWYREAGFSIDVAVLRRKYPWMLTLEEYLRASGWTNQKQ
ncbi:MAG: NmrA/HSCARG family protein [Gammaproteobacteria bacterium]